MKRSKFIKIIEEVMERVSTHECDIFTCNHLGGFNYNIRRDFENVYGNGNSIPARFRQDDESEVPTEERKKRRLNALSMYLAQSLAFETYKNL